MKIFRITIVAMSFFASQQGALADDIVDAIKEGSASYRKGDLSNAVAQLDYAATLIRQEKAKKIVSVFPKPFKSWEADEPESDASAGAMLGGGISARRVYYKSDQTVEIELMLDSPMLQSIMPMFNNPTMIAMSGGKLIKVQGHKAIFKNEDGNIEITLVVNNNAMLTIRGAVESESDIKAYAEALVLASLN